MYLMGIKKNAEIYRISYLFCEGASLVTQWYRICLPKQETWVQSLGWEDPLKKEKATQSSILAWEIPWTEDPGGLHYIGLHKVGQDVATEHAHTSLVTEAKYLLNGFLLYT